MGTPLSPPRAYPDAIMVPKPFQKLAEPEPLFNRLFLASGVMGPKARRLYSRHLNFERPPQFFITTHPDDVLHFPKTHPLATLPRYDWWVVGESDTAPLNVLRPTPGYNAAPGTVRFGWLRDEDAITPAGLDARVDFERQYHDQVAALLPKFARARELLSRPPAELTAAERDELAEIQGARPLP